jgi:hypothetical protein
MRDLGKASAVRVQAKNHSRHTSPARPPERPDLQEWIARYGSYTAIPWGRWDREMEAWKAWLRSGDRYYQK